MGGRDRKGNVWVESRIEGGRRPELSSLGSQSEASFSFYSLITDSEFVFIKTNENLCYTCNDEKIYALILSSYCDNGNSTLDSWAKDVCLFNRYFFHCLCARVLLASSLLRHYTQVLIRPGNNLGNVLGL